MRPGYHEVPDACEVVVFSRITRLESIALQQIAKIRKTNRSTLIREAIRRVLSEAEVRAA